MFCRLLNVIVPWLVVTVSPSRAGLVRIGIGWEVGTVLSVAVWFAGVAAGIVGSCVGISEFDVGLPVSRDGLAVGKISIGAELLGALNTRHKIIRPSNTISADPTYTPIKYLALGDAGPDNFLGGRTRVTREFVIRFRTFRISGNPL